MDMSPADFFTAQSNEVIVERNTTTGLTAEIVSEELLWAEKRARQVQDIAEVNAGRASAMAMGWFSEERVSQARVLDAPY